MREGFQNWSPNGHDGSTLASQVYPAAYQVQRPTILDPLTGDERTLVCDHIRKDITAAAAELLHGEQQTKAKLHTLHLKCISLLILASCAVAYAMIYLQGVLVPFTLAAFFMFTLEPLLFAFLKLPILLGKLFPRFKPVADRLEQERAQKKKEREDARKRAALARRTHNAGEADEQSDCDSEMSPDEQTRSPAPFQISAASLDQPMGNCGGTGKVLILKLSWRMWSLIGVLLALCSLLTFIVLLAVLIVKELNEFPWEKYAKSKRLQLVLRWFPHIGADPKNFQFHHIMPWLMQGFLMDVVGTMFRVISMAFLTLLFLAFLLAADVDLLDIADSDDEFFGIAHKVRESVRRYIKIKTRIAFVVACLICVLFWLLEVDLAFVFAILTFLLSYIPHVGYTVAVLAPLPLVFLDPTKTWGDLIIVFICPFIIHQFASNLIEPKLLAESLDLHPIVVLLALAFWTTVWGAVGAILSVPLTAVLRLILLEVDHPYTQPVVNLLKGRLTDSPVKANSLTRAVLRGEDTSETDLNSPRTRSPKTTPRQRRPNLPSPNSDNGSMSSLRQRRLNDIAEMRVPTRKNNGYIASPACSSEETSNTQSPSPNHSPGWSTGEKPNARGRVKINNSATPPQPAGDHDGTLTYGGHEEVTI